MQDKRRRGQGDELDQAVHRAIGSLLEHVPPDRQRTMLADLRGQMGHLLANTPSEGDAVEDLAARARLAAAFRARLPEED